MSKVISHVEKLRVFDSLNDFEKSELLKELRKVSLLTPDFANAKTAKNQGLGFASYIMHLAPFKVSGFNMCPAASKGCAAACLNTAGRGKFKFIQNSRIRKTLYFVKAKNDFLNHLVKEITRLEKKAIKDGKKLVIRLNGTSDLPWENIKIDGKNIFDTFPNVQFYDYTAVINRLRHFKLAKNKPVNYYLTFSAKEDNQKAVNDALKFGYNVAMVFDSIPETFQGYKVINGDAHDLRFLDKGQGVIVGLNAKGDAKKDISGFVRRVSEGKEFAA